MHRLNENQESEPVESQLIHYFCDVIVDLGATITF